jgi:hypothetical protein
VAYHAAFRLVAGVREEFDRRRLAAWGAEREIRRGFERGAETYYEHAVEEHGLGEAAKGPWRELLAWADGQPELLALFSDEVEALRARVGRRVPPPAKEDFEGHFDEDVAEFHLDRGDLAGLAPLLDANGVPHDTHRFPFGKEVTTIEVGGDLWVIEPGPPLSYWKDAAEWLEDASGRPEEFYGERDESAEFWGGAGPGSYLYHVTGEDNVGPILSGGLEARSDTRGLQNMDIGPAVFAVTGESMDGAFISVALEAYGEAVIRIDAGAMKADGYTPEVARETPLVEAEARESLARGVGWDDYEADRPGDYMEDTVAILGDIPPKYLSLDRHVGSGLRN